MQQEYPVELEWWPFELHPEVPPEGRPRGEASGRPNPAMEAAHAAGIPMIRPSVIANSRLALEASEFVRATAPEAFEGFHKAVFHAYFVEDRNIGEVDVLTGIAETLGVDTAALRAALAERTYAPAVDDRIQWAVSRGITSTPFFLFAADKLYAVPGAQEYPVFQSVMERLGVSPRASEDGSDGGAADGDEPSSN